MFKVFKIDSLHIIYFVCVYKGSEDWVENSILEMKP